MQGFFKHGLLDMKSWLSKKAHSRPHTRAASCPVVVAVTGGTGVNLPSSSKRGCARWAGCRMSQGRPQMAETGAFHGAGRKAAGPSCVGGFLPRVLPCGHSACCPKRTGTHHAEPSCCPPLLNLCALSSAPAHASAGIQTSPHCWQQSAHSKQPTQGSCNLQLQHQHVPPCTLWLGFTCELSRHRLC